ncbi:MAG: hypothetical protein ACOYM3_30830 [Terrimicrobiaceae bacterium]
MTNIQALSGIRTLHLVGLNNHPSNTHVPLGVETQLMDLCGSRILPTVMMSCPLCFVAKPFYFAHHAGQMAVASSVEAKAGDKIVRVGFSNSYRGTTDDAAILRVTGESRNRWGRLRQTALPAQPPFAGRQTGGMRINGAAFFKQSFELKIKGDLIPEAAAEEIIGELQALFARHKEVAR